MALLREVAEKLSNNELVSGVIQEIIEKDATLALMPFVPTNSKAYVYNREKTLPGADFLSVGDEISESSADFDEITAKLRILAGDVDIDKFLAETMSDTNDQVAIQVAQKAKAVNRQFHICLARGNSTTNSKQFDGLPNLVSTDQTIYADGKGSAGAALSLSMLDELKDAVPLTPDAFIVRSGTRRAILQAMRAAGGTTPEMMKLENFDGGPVLVHDGVPIIVNDFLAKDEKVGDDATCSIYAVRFNEADGLFGLYGGPTAGVRVEDVGTVQNKDASRIRLKWYCSAALKSTKSLARLSGVTNV